MRSFPFKILFARQRSIFQFSNEKKLFQEFYKSVYPTLETLRVPVVITIMEKLRSVNMIDKEMWDKFEISFVRHISRLTKDDLINTVKLINTQSYEIMSRKLFYYLEAKISQQSSNLTNLDLYILMVSLLPIPKVTNAFKNQILMKFKEKNFMELSPLNLLKVATAIIENEQLNIEVSLSILREIHKLIKVESLTGKEMTLYLHIYYTNLIEEFVKKACTLQSNQVNLNEILSGVKLPRTFKPQETQLRLDKLETLSSYIDSFNRNKLSFENFLLSQKYLSVCIKHRASITKETMDLIMQQFNNSYSKLTASEIVQILSALQMDSEFWLDHQKEKQVLFYLVGEFCQKYSADLQVQDYSQLIKMNNELLKSKQQFFNYLFIGPDLNERLLSQTIFSIDKVSLINLVTFGISMDQSKVIFKDQNVFVDTQRRLFDSIQAFIRINRKHDFQHAISYINWITSHEDQGTIKVLRNVNLFCLQILAKEIDFHNSSQVQLFLFKVNEFNKEGKISDTYKQQILQELDKRFSNLPI